MTTKSDDIVEAAIARLARGDGAGGLRALGIQKAQLMRDSSASKGTLYSDRFKPDSHSDVAYGVLDVVMEKLLEEQLRLREEASEAYEERAEIVAYGGGRHAIASALLKELAQYGAVPDANDLTRARERAYYLAVALADVSASRFEQEALSPDDEIEPDHRFRDHALILHRHHQDRLIELYGGFLAAANREPIHDVERVEAVISAFLEGVLLTRRVEQGHGGRTEKARRDEGSRPKLDDEGLVDALLRIFIAMSQPIGGVPTDPDVLLFGRDHASAEHIPSEAIVHRDRESAYEKVLAEIDRLGVGDTLSHCALHTAGARPLRTEQGERLADAQERLLARGGHLRDLVKLGSVEELEHIVARIAAERESDPYRSTSFRALVMDSPPSLSPMIAGGSAAFLGREVDGLIVDVVAFRDPAGISWCGAHYDTLWHDERAFPIATPKGLNPRAVDAARRALEERGADSAG